jgi:hypothetical protein
MENIFNSQELLEAILISAAILLISIAGVLATLVSIPKDYFIGESPPAAPGRSRFLKLSIMLIKNLLGIVLLIAGIIMIFLPGQGLLTVLIGIMMIDFPGKRKLEKKIIAQPKLLSSINALRKRFGKEPLITE